MVQGAGRMEKSLRLMPCALLHSVFAEVLHLLMKKPMIFAVKHPESFTTSKEIVKLPGNA